ncbi:hypothetical protein CEXT_741351 [Caerostris extrusa]|uniref:Uncharacterized protein n=1 Tax=Caerostris extrusa TaxID=172846 RepID=A0AAV4M631_CAEEX|nr:hypothetical protein CEXT_741351 [Caerostris extrusa]
MLLEFHRVDTLSVDLENGRIEISDMSYKQSMKRTVSAGRKTSDERAYLCWASTCAVIPYRLAERARLKIALFTKR